MQIRCASCHGAVWVQITAGKKNGAIVRCQTCSQEYDLSSILERIDAAELHQDALALAKTSEIDLQSSYSVLLGILRLEEARDDCDPNLVSADDTADTGPTVDFDHAFAEAVKAGHLTPAQALQRGDRQAFAQRLVARHQLPPDQALAVADNRIPLLEAIRSRKPTARINVEPERPRRSALPFVIAGAAILVVGVFFAQLRSSEEAAKPAVRPDSARPALNTVEVTVNLDGEPVKVSGPNPESVLAGYCESASSGEKVPVGVEAGDGDWTGLYREGGTLYALEIRQGLPLGRWVAGNAGEPIEVKRSLIGNAAAAQHSNAASERIVVGKDSRGSVVRVSAPDPAAVLLAYCALQTAGSGCEPLELRAGTLAEAGLRLGIFRDFSEQLLRITIRRQQTDGRWFAGNGSRLIEVALAGESPPGVFAMPVGR